jgi:hypothetical protein
MQLVRVLVNQLLLEFFCEEDTWVDASVMRHVKRVLVQNDDSDARCFHTLLQLWQHDARCLFTAANLQHNCTLQRVSKSSKGDDNLNYLDGLFRCGVHAILPIGLAYAFAPKVT